jgi:hypothetical protein
MPLYCSGASRLFKRHRACFMSHSHRTDGGNVNNRLVGLLGAATLMIVTVASKPQDTAFVSAIRGHSAQFTSLAAVCAGDSVSP